jgi:hypothetical protein
MAEEIEVPGKPINLGGGSQEIPVYTPVGPGSMGGGSPRLSSDQLYAGIQTQSSALPNISASSLPDSSRYNVYLPGRDMEEMYGQQQSTWEKWGNGFGKMVGTATTSFLNGTVGTVYGIGSMIRDAKVSSFYDNEFGRGLDSTNKYLENYLPNFYTKAEKDASWYSPDNILTANFFSDKVLKNLGYSIGSIGAGFAWGGILKSIGLTNRLVQAGRGLETVEAVENAILTAPKIGRYGAVNNALTGLSNQYLKPLGAKSLTNADRGLTSVFGTMGESSFESLQNLNAVREKMIKSYISKYGKEPTGTALDEINDYAEKVGNYTWGMNVALLSATNYIQLPKILNSSKVAERRMMNQIVKENVEKGVTLADRVAAKYIKSPSLLEAIAGKPGRLFNKYVVNPAALLFAPIEAFEEGAQYSIQIGTEDYFSRAYNVNDDVSSFWENVSGAFENVLGEGVNKTLSTKEGLESILIGGLSGGIQTSFSPFGQNTIKERGFFGEGGIKGTNTEDAIKAINDSKNINQVLKDAVKYGNIAINSQKLRQEDIANNDTLNEKDHEQDYTLSYIMPRVKYGKVDSIKEEIGLYKQQSLSDQGFQELQNEGVVLTGETREKFIQRLDNITQTATQVNKTFELFDDKYSVLLDKDGKRLYTDDLIEKMTYASAKVIDYDKRTSELQSKLAGQGILTSEIDLVLFNNAAWKTGDIKTALNDKDVQAAILKVSSELENLESINQDEIVEDLSDYVDLTIRRKSFLEDFNEMKSNPEKFKTEEPVAPENQLAPPPLKPGETVPTISIKTKTGEKQIEIGTEYFLGRVVGKDKNGKDVYRLPRLTVLGENEDGTIQIKDNNGVRNISKEEFEDYKLAKVETTLSNKKAKYFLEHWNTKFEFNFGKGIKQIGRLEWNDKDKILTFVYLNKKGQRKEIEVTGDQFIPKKGFTDPMIKAVGQLTKEQEKAQEELAEDAKTDPRVAVKRAERIRILAELFDELSVRQDKTIALIDRKQKQIAKIKEDLAKLEQEIANAEVDGRSKNSVRFKAATKKALANAISLSRTQEQLEEQVVYLENDSQELDFNLSYISDLISNVDLLPTDSKELLAELNENLIDLEVLQETTYKQIATITSLIKETEKALNSFIDFISNLIEKFEAKFPNVPRIMGQDYVDFLKTNPNFLKLKPYYREELSELEDLIGMVEDGDISPSQTKLDDLKEHLAIMEKDAQEFQKEIDVKTLVLKKFEEVAAKYKAQKAEEDKLQRDEKLIEQFIGTLGGYTQTHVNDKSYEAASKKTIMEVVLSTIGSGKDDANKPFNIRLKNFAFKFNKLVNKDTIRGVIVTNDTQNDIIPGLTEHLMSDVTEKQKAKYDHTKTIVLVITDADGNPVDENGVTIPKGADLLNTAIYQVFPTEKLTAEYNGKMESMFREGTDPKIEASLREQYAEWRASILARTELSKPVSISRSFGIAEYSKIKNQYGEEINYDVRNSVEEAGLITNDDLVQSQAITVATTNDSIEFGNTTFKTPLGGVFLKVKDGLYKLFNRKFNEKEATAIYDVIHQLSKNGNGKEGKLSPESTNLINWLKSVVYWGINKTQEGERKEAGYNSVWFETVKEDDKKVTRLFISAKEKDSTQQFEFTPTGLEERKADIILLLTKLYSNTDAKLVNNSGNYNNKYYQITGINSEGKPITTTWPNYQSYLLSDKTPDGSPREVPLSTPIRKLNGEDDVNKDGYYFTLTDDSEFEIPELVSEAPVEAPLAPAAEEKEETSSPVVPVQAAPVAATPQKFNLEGGENTIPIGTFGNVKFRLNGEKYIETDGKKGLDFDIPFDTLASLILARNISEDAGRNLIANVIIAKFKPQLDAMSLTSPETIEEVAEAAPIITPVTEEEVKADTDKLAEILAKAAKIAPRDNEANRIKLEKEIEDFTPEDWNKIEAFIKKVLPTIPFYRVKNMIEATNGRQAWGMLHKGAIYVTENAEVGTAYHEVFEAIWKMFSSPEEKKAILNEFKNRSGSFVDRETGITITYKDATAQQVKEQLAEEFRDYVLTGKHFDKNQGKSFIGRMFSELMDFIKAFFTEENALGNTQQLFENITSGYYAKYNPYESNLSYANKGIIDIDTVEAGEGAEFRLTPIPAQQMIDIVEDMTYSTLATLSKNNEDLFTAGASINKKQTLAKLNEEILNRVSEQIAILNSIKNDPETIESEKKKAIANQANKVNLYKKIESDWDLIVKRYEKKLKTFSIEFDENDNLLRTDEDNTGKGDYIDSRKIDNFRKANSAIKLLFGTLARTVVTKTGKIELDPSTIGGAQLIPSDKVFITLKNALYDSLTVDQMFDRLKAIGQSDSDYAVLYYRITRSKVTDASIDFDKLQEHDLQLISAFWKAMKGQNANVISVFTLPSGQVVIGDSNLSQASRQAKRKLSNEIISSIKTDNPYIKYNESTGKYNVATNNKGEKIIDSYVLYANDLKTYTSFLKNIGIVFNEKELKQKLSNDQQLEFKTVVEGIKKSLSNVNNVVSLSNTSLEIDGTLLKLGSIQSIIEYPEFESTYFNVNGERTQTYLGSNALSELYAVLKSIKNIKELEGTNYGYLLTDVFSKGDASVMLNKMFNVATTGNRRDGTEELLHPVYIDGTIDEKKNKKTESSKLSIKQRIIQEINLNISGVFMNLVPGDASIEWAIRMFNKKSPFVTKEDFDYDEHLKIFSNYFISEVNLAKDGRTTAKPNNSGELRFFKDILGEDYKKVWNATSKKESGEKIYDDNKAVIDKAVNKFIAAEAADTRDLLDVYGITKLTDEGLAVEDLAFTEGETITEEELAEKLNLLAVNYIIANIEMHKLIYSDPYQYKEELKRIKNFLSPRQPLLTGSSLLNSTFNKLYNKFYDKDDIGYSDMTTEIFRSSVIADIFSTDELPGYDTPYEETDGGGYISLKANRIFGIRAGSWTPSNDLQYRYDIAYEKTVRGENLTEEKKKEKGLTLTKEEKNFNIRKIVNKEDGKVSYIGNNPNVKSTYTTRKPIVSGNKADGKNYNDIVLDKFALTPLSYRILHELNPTSNALKLYDKMQAEEVDYVVYNSGRKVGAGIATPLYKTGGEFNTDVFKEINNIPFTIMGVQSEVPSKEESIVTQGSQITKLVTLDFLEAGMPIDFMPEEKDFNKRYVQWIALEDKESYNEGDNLYKEIINNQTLLEEKIKQGYKILLSKLGITESTNDKNEKTFKITNVDKLIDTLTNEILKREVNENIIKAFEQFKENKGIILEATPAYQQIRNILYSIANKNVISPKISGGSKVQVSSALLESVRAEGKEITDKEGVTRTVYGSTDLKFYRNKNGERVCQIMIGRWFKSDMSDKDLLDYLNKTDEGKKILRGVAFRIPTQKQNSIDVFEIKRFLPDSFGDNVIIPSALVKKAGSDFDIDKLSMYLKNVFQDASGRLKIVTRKGNEEESKKEYTNLYREKILNKVDKIQNTEQFKNDLLNILYKIEKVENNQIDFANNEEEKFFNDNKEILQEIINQASDAEINPSDYIKDQLSKIEGKKEELVSKLFNINLKEDFVNNMYKKALDNEYIQSLENIISHPLNFDNLIKPNSAKELEDLSKEIVVLTGQKKIDYSSVGNMLNRRFMSQLRQDFVTGKFAIGIAATAQTNHADNQRTFITIDRDKLNTDAISDVDKYWLGNGIINLPHNTVENKATLSMINNTDGRSISDIIGQFIDGFVDISKGPWIMKLGATPNVVGTWLFLTKVGVPIRTTAYFMNQPIIRDYLSNIQSDGYSYLFMDQYVNDVKEQYPTSKNVKATYLPGEKELKDMLSGKDLKPLQNAQQHLILDEFLKYAKMAEHLFKVQQATNFDTANLNDNFLIFKKIIQLERTKNTIISSADDLLNTSFKNVLKNAIFDIRNAFAQILLSDKGRVREVMQAVLLPYVDRSDRDFVKISQTAVNTLFDWAMLNSKHGESQYSNQISKTLLGNSTEKSAATQIIEFRDAVKKNPNHVLHNNIVLNKLEIEAGKKTSKPDNLYLAGRDNVYDQNLIIDGFREIREALGTENKDLYGKLVRVAILQSGLTVSPISFTSLLPYEDFNEVYNVALATLENLPNLADFQKLNIFERTNWNNTDAIPSKSAFLVKNVRGGMTNINEDFLDKGLVNAMNKGEVTKVISISTKSLEGRSDFMTYSWQSDVIFDSEKGEFVILTKKLKAIARRKGDYSYVKKGLFQRVYVENENGVRVPFTQTSKDGKYINYLYKMVNAWGDSYRANESYDVVKPSILDNDYQKVIIESTDDDVLSVLDNLPATAPATSVKVKLKDGNSYTSDQLGAKMLLAMGYTSQEAGKIIKDNKC